MLLMKDGKIFTIFCLAKDNFDSMKKGSFLYLVFYVACSVLGFSFDRIVYSFQLLDIIN